MSWDPALPRVLAKIYPSVDESKIVVDAARMDLTTVIFDEAAVDNWLGILGAANRLGAPATDEVIRRIVEKATNDCPTIEMLLAEERRLLDLEAQASPASGPAAKVKLASPLLVAWAGADAVESLSSEIAGVRYSPLSGVADYLLRVQPLSAVAYLVLSGILFLLVAQLTLGSTIAAVGTGPKMVGFFWAVNWSVSLTVVFPFAAFFVLLTLQAAPRVFGELAARRMLVSVELRPVAEAVAVEAWNRAFRSRMRGVALVAAVGLIASLGEWWVQSAQPLFQNDPASTASAIRREVVEPDWTIDALFDSRGALQQGTDTARVATSILTLAAFVNQALWIAFFVVLLYTMWAVGRTTQALSDDTGQFRLVPDVHSDDRRRGFEVFEPFIDLALWAVAGFYTMFYLSRVWNAYLRSPSPTLSEFVLQIRVLSITDDWSTISLIFAAMLAFMASVVLVAWILRDAARQARDYFEKRLKETPEQVAVFTGMTTTATADRLQRMKFWPTNNLRPNILLILVVLGVFAIVTGTNSFRWRCSVRWSLEALDGC